MLGSTGVAAAGAEPCRAHASVSRSGRQSPGALGELRVRVPGVPCQRSRWHRCRGSGEQTLGSGVALPLTSPGEGLHACRLRMGVLWVQWG